MFAIVETGGKQYKVQEGDILEVERLAPETIKDNTVTIEAVLLFSKDDDVRIGNPFVPGCVVTVVVLEDIKAEKIIIFKKKPKKQYKRTRGHRQKLHKIRVEKIQMA
jgi:large subunit ribosomal protein L21